LAATANRQGLTLVVLDGLIAATAVHHELTLVTRNVKGFVALEVEVLNRDRA
jgi:predicted nucleic acid-binding protein